MLHARRMLGLDGIGAGGRTRLKAMDGTAFVVDDAGSPADGGAPMPIHEKSLIRPENLQHARQARARRRRRLRPLEHVHRVERGRPITTSAWRRRSRRCPGGEYIHRCWQCGSCTNACTVNAINQDFNPRFWIYLIRMGMESELLRDKDIIWQCVSCNKCTYACPRDVVPGGRHEGDRALARAQRARRALDIDAIRRGVRRPGDRHRQDRGGAHHPPVLRPDRAAAACRNGWSRWCAGCAAPAGEARLRMGLSALVRPRTRGWSKAREAIKAYVGEQKAKQHEALGIAELIETARRDAATGATH